MKISIAIQPRHVKAEAARRIEAAWPLWKQSNVLRAGGADLDRMNAEIDGIRSASDRIEAMSPIPADFKDQKYWSAP